MPSEPVQIKIKQKFREIQKLWSQNLSCGHLPSFTGISWVYRLNLLPYQVYARCSNLVLHLKILLMPLTILMIKGRNVRSQEMQKDHSRKFNIHSCQKFLKFRVIFLTYYFCFPTFLAFIFTA